MREQHQARGQAQDLPLHIFIKITLWVRRNSSMLTSHVETNFALLWAWRCSILN